MGQGRAETEAEVGSGVKEKERAFALMRLSHQTSEIIHVVNWPLNAPAF